MLRTLIGALGAVTALFPDGIVALFEKFAIANPDEGTFRAWLTPAIRSEGVLIAVITILGGRSYGWLMNLTGVSGAVVLVFPNLYRKFATTLLYENGESIEWTEHSSTGLRVIGAVNVFFAAVAYRDRRKEA